MLKRLGLAFAGLFALVQLASGAGTVPGFSLAQQQDSDGSPLVGCRLFTIQAGTTSTPQTAYQDAALTIPLPNPIICDAYGRIAQFFLADGSIKLRLTKSNGVQVFAADGILVVGASSGGGGGSPVDATTILATGDLKIVYGTGVLSGFVRANGRTIGSATSGATERANLDTQALFEYLWNTDANLAVSTGRGVSAANDFAANKTLTLPDWRGRALAGLDDMGNSAAGRLTATYFGTAATTLGAAGGAESKTLLTANLPAYTPSGSVASSLSSFAPQIASTANGGQAAFATSTISGGQGNLTAAIVMGISSSFTGTAQGGTSTPFAVASPMMLATIYLKL